MNIRHRAAAVICSLVWLLGCFVDHAHSAEAWNEFSPIVEQPIHSYLSEEIPYSNQSASFGKMGPGEAALVWRDGQVCVDRLPAEWAGMWHSVASDPGAETSSMDFSKAYPAWMVPKYQPKIRALVLTARGRGALKVELKSSDGQLAWSAQQKLNSNRAKECRLPVPTQRLQDVAQVNWVAPQGTSACIDSLAMELQFKPHSFSEHVFLVSFAKLSRCFNPHLYTVRDKAHAPAGQQDSVPAAGFLCLAAAAAADMGMVQRDAAVDLLRRVQHQVASLPAPLGVLPHFIQQSNGQYTIMPNTEFSTVDTAIYYHSMLIASQMLGEEEVQVKLLGSIQSIEIEKLLDSEGYVSHGLKTDGRTLLASSWADWGGESALVVLLQKIARPRSQPKMKSQGKVWRGIGFIAEMQTLFYPQFSRPVRDRLTGINWKQARFDLFQQQRTYFAPDLPCSQLGVFGLSAGEGLLGNGYPVSGVEDADCRLIHPHYMLLTWDHWEDPRDLYVTLSKMREQGLLPPCGLVENVDVELQTPLPFNGALNASFEAISAYHLWAAANKKPDAIYQAARACEPLRKAMRIFYR